MGISPSALITSSIITAPAAMMLAKILVPSTKPTDDIKNMKIHISPSVNVIEAAVNGASDGMWLALNVATMLIAFVGIVAVVDGGFGLMHSWLANIGFLNFPSNLKELFGFIFQPLGWLIGIPAEEVQKFGSLMGTRVSLNEFIAFSDLSEMIKNHQVSQRFQILTTFALCGFGNFGSIAIQIGGIGSMSPEKKPEIAQLGLKAMIAGILGNLLTAAIVSLLISY